MVAPPSKVEAGIYRTWVRPSDAGKYFPQNKYGFSQHLKRVGDYIETFPMNHADMERFRNAAYHWAWVQDKTIKMKRLRKPDENREKMWAYRMHLTKQHRKRDFG